MKKFNLGMCCKQLLASGDLGTCPDFETIWVFFSFFGIFELKRKLEAFKHVICLGIDAPFSLLLLW